MVSHRFFANRSEIEHTEKFIEMLKEEDKKIKFSNNVFVTVEKTSPSNGQIPNGHTKSSRATTVNSIIEDDEDEVNQ